MAEEKMMLHIHREIEDLKRRIVLEATMAEDNLRDSIRALMNRDAELALEIVDKDKALDEQEVEFEEECLKILALYQPVAVDLRYIVAFLKVNNDIERIGDLASNIARGAASLAVKEELAIPADIPVMSEMVQKMLKKSIEALIDLDHKKSQKVQNMDDKVDELHHSMYKIVGQRIQEYPDLVDSWMEVLGTSRYLERIADHCTNICEDVEYMLSGQIIRHGN
ncbi:MAG: phosphate signaling complex protein PhoU [Candidatus Marinimicrobia bacterium]|nr:phosphate signaling complex protein PhoU [Candidatus Neomarinimicrobiota bacterium]